jgi:hypothetical protein
MAVNVGEIVATTLRNRSPQLADNVSQNTELLKRLKAKGNMKKIGGGRTIFQPLEYAENGTYKRYSGYQPLNISPSTVIDGAEYNWKQVAVAVSISGLEQLQNSGKEAVINLLESRIGNAERTMMNNMSADCYSDGTADGGLQIGGLQLLIADDPTTGTVGGIDRSAQTFWQNQLYDFSVEGTNASATTIQAAMNTLYLRCKRNNDVPDLIVFDNVYYGYYWASLQAIQRITSDGTGQAGYATLKFMGSDVVCDGGQGGDCPASHGYFLNTSFIKLVTHSDRNFVPLDPDRYATNQDAMVKLIGWAGNMALSNSALQGVMHA